MRKYVYLCAFILLAHVSRAQINQTTVYSKIYFEANQAQFEETAHLNCSSTHLAKAIRALWEILFRMKEVYLFQMPPMSKF